MSEGTGSAAASAGVAVTDASDVGGVSESSLSAAVVFAAAGAGSDAGGLTTNVSDHGNNQFLSEAGGDIFEQIRSIDRARFSSLRRVGSCAYVGVSVVVLSRAENGLKRNRKKLSCYCYLCTTTTP